MTRYVLVALALSAVQASVALAGEANNLAAVEIPAGTGVYFSGSVPDGRSVVSSLPVLQGAETQQTNAAR